MRKPVQMTLWYWELDDGLDLWIDGTRRACRWCFTPFGLAPTRDAERVVFGMTEQPLRLFACPDCDGMRVTY